MEHKKSTYSKSHKRYYEKNKKELVQSFREYYLKHREERLIYMKRYRQEHKDIYKKYDKEHREEIDLRCLLRRLGWLKVENFDMIPVGEAFSIFRNKHFASLVKRVIICEYCNKAFIQKRKGKQRFCSRECRIKAYRRKEE